MQHKKLIERIRTRLDAPELFTAKAKHLDRCLPWPQNGPIVRNILRKIWTVEGPYLAPVTVKSTTRIQFKGQRRGVHMVIHEITNKPTSPYRSMKICHTPFCVNPNHWVFTDTARAYDPTDYDAIPPHPPEDLGEWSLEEAQGLLDGYFLENTYPINREHNLLIDIPPDLLTEAIKATGKFQL